MPRLATTTITTIAIHVVIVFATSSALFFHLSGRTAFRVFGGNLRRADVFDDVDRHYFFYADRMIGDAQVPYRDFPVEYPLLALPAFVVPYFFASGQDHYRVAFGIEMLLCDTALLALMASQITRREGAHRVAARMAWTCACVLGFGSLLVARYDLLPTLLAFGGAMLWANGRAFSGGAVLGLGGLVKIYPGLVAGPLFVRGFPLKTSARGAIGLIVTTAAGMALWAALAGKGLISSFAYHAERGFEMGSIYAGVFGIVAKLTGSELTFQYLHSSMEIATPWAARFAPVAMPIQAATLGLVLWRARRSSPEEWPRFGAAMLLAFIVTGKVLSPQYLIWLLPFIAVMEGEVGRRSRGIFLAGCFVTALVFPWAQYGMTKLHPIALGLLNVRNSLLMVLMILLISPERSEIVRR